MSEAKTKLTLLEEKQKKMKEELELLKKTIKSEKQKARTTENLKKRKQETRKKIEYGGLCKLADLIKDFELTQDEYQHKAIVLGGLLHLRDIIDTRKDEFLKVGLELLQEKSKNK